MKRLVLLLGLVMLAACATVDMDASDVRATVRDALDDADIEHDGVTTADAPAGNTWDATVRVGDGAVTMTVQRSSGRITAIDIPEGIVLTDEQLQSLAEHEGNPADQDARRQRTVVLVLLLIGGVAGGLAWARRQRLKEEAALRAT